MASGGPPDPPFPDMFYAMNVAVMSLSFAEVVQGTITAEYDSVFSGNGTSVLLTNLFKIKPRFTEADDFRGDIDFSLNYPRLGGALVSLFTNLTLATMIERNATVGAVMNSFPSHSVWTYDPASLWLTYGSAILVSVLAAICGLWMMKSNEEAMDQTFSQYMLATRDGSISTLCSRTAKHKKLLEVPLKFNRDKTFVVSEATTPENHESHALGELRQVDDSNISRPTERDVSQEIV